MIRIFILIFLFTGIFSCKKIRGGSDSKNVDAIAKGDKTQRHDTVISCGKTTLSNDNAVEARDRVFAAVPSTIKSLLPEGKSNISLENFEDVIKRCGNYIDKLEDQILAEELKENVKNVGSCFDHVDILDDKDELVGRKLTIHIVKNKVAVHQELISAVSFAVLEAVVDKPWISDVVETVKALDQKTLTKEQKTLLASLEKKEILLKEQTLKISKPRSDLVDAIIADMEKFDEQTVVSRYKKIVSGKNDNMKSMLENFLLSEFIDSYYCSADTKKQIADGGFTSSLKYFEEKYVPVLGKADWQ